MLIYSKIRVQKMKAVIRMNNKYYLKKVKKSKKNKIFKHTKKLNIR